MKKIIALLLVLSLSIYLVACDGKDASSDVTSEPDTQSSEVITSGDEASDVTSSEESEPAKDSSKEETSNSSTQTLTSHSHTYSKATCTEAEKCSCGATKGKALGHKWQAATCAVAKTCTVCKATEGKALGHKFEGKICTVCKETESGYKAAFSTDKTFSIVLAEALYNKCKVQTSATSDGIQIAVEGASCTGLDRNAPSALIFSIVHNSSCATFEQNWKSETHSVVFEQAETKTNEELGLKLEKVATQGDFSVYCQYINERSNIGGGNQAKAVMNEVLDKKAEIIKTIKFY